MLREKTVFVILVILIVGLFLAAGTVTAAPSFASTSSTTPEATETPRVATEEELQVAYAEWSASRHADTYDDGLGANTNCARCKSPLNWDPENKFQEEALDCYSCKREPGEDRPDLSGSEMVDPVDWMNIGCEICHQPIGSSYAVELSFWDQANQVYIPVEETSELCAKCHEGPHGFEVIEEQAVSPAHNQWECTQCHGMHGAPSACTDCHDPQTASGAIEHARHPSVNCTACHDAGKLGIWLEDDPTSKHFSQYITRRFAHTLTSWPSHNLSKEVDCLRCHHPPNWESPVLAQDVSCESCHPDGEVLFWCEYFPRDGNPNATPVDGP
jgi:hypothetical protein